MIGLLHRIASEGDIAFINSVYNENIDALHGAPRTYDRWKELLSDKDTIYYIVYTDIPVAWFRIDHESNGLWLGMLQVKPKYQRQGIGRYILSVLENMAKEKALPMVGIHTTEDNIPARALYTSTGFSLSEIGPCTTADGVDRVGYTFQKEIQI